MTSQASINNIEAKTGKSASQVLAARLSMLGTSAVLLLVLLLHVVKPEFDPSWRFISEYAIGQNGWIMTAFSAWALSCVALFLALRGGIASGLGRIGSYLLLIVAVALIFAGLFPVDPVTAKPEELTQVGSIHAIASMVGIPGIPVAAMLISSSLVRNSPAWARYRAPVMGLAHLTWISPVLMMIYLAWAVPKAGGFNADVWAGWLNRFVVATYLAWQLLIAYRIQNLSSSR
jgi:hypothetical protein